MTTIDHYYQSEPITAGWFCWFCKRLILWSEKTPHVCFTRREANDGSKC